MKVIMIVIWLLFQTIVQAMDVSSSSSILSLSDDILNRISLETRPYNEDLFSTCKKFHEYGKRYFSSKYESLKKLTWSEIPFIADEQRFRLTLKIANAARLYYRMCGVNVNIFDKTENLSTGAIRTTREYFACKDHLNDQLSRLSEHLATEIEEAFEKNNNFFRNLIRDKNPISHLFLWVKDYAAGDFQIRSAFTFIAKLEDDFFPKLHGPQDSLVAYGKTVCSLLENKDYSVSGEIALHYLFIHLLCHRLNYEASPVAQKNCFIFNAGGFDGRISFPKLSEETIQKAKNPLIDSVFGPCWKSARQHYDTQSELKTLKRRIQG